MHSHLAAGLRDLGHSVTVASSGDGWKRLSTDIHLGFDHPNVLRKVERNIKPFFLIEDLCNFDIVQLQNPVVFPWKFGVNAWAIRRIARSSKHMFLSAAGDDAFFWRNARRQLRYGPFDDFLKYDLKAEYGFWQSERMWRWNEEVVNMVTSVIPVCYEYWLGYRECPKVSPIIPLPINCGAIRYTDNRVIGKLRIAHGLSREGFKGTRLIRAALDQVAKRYPKDIEVIYLDKLPYNQYLDALRQTNILIDQALSHSWGMSALIALAMGKVVLSGAEPEALEALGILESPVINICPDVNSIRNEIEKLIPMRNLLPAMGQGARQFVEQTHDCRRIANQYMEAWSMH